MCILKRTRLVTLSPKHSSFGVRFNITSIFFPQEGMPSTSPPVHSVFIVRCPGLVPVVYCTLRSTITLEQSRAFYLLRNTV
jgi:hypothetical protein